MYQGNGMNPMLTFQDGGPDARVVDGSGLQAQEAGNDLEMMVDPMLQNG